MSERPASYEDALARLAAQRDDLVVLTAENRAAIRGLPARLGPRFIDVGIAEMTMVGAAAGLALRGRTPVVHALATFLTLRAFEFIRTDVGIPGLPVKLVGGVPGFLSDANGPTHQALEDIALMRGVPGMQVYCPADREELIDMLPRFIEDRAPAYLRYYAGEPAVTHLGGFAPGRAEVLAEGADVTLLTYGFLLREVEGCRAALAARGLRVGLVNLRTIAPLDEAEVLRALRRPTLMVTVEDHFERGGLATAVAECALRAGPGAVRARVLPIALPGRWFRPALLPRVLAHEGFTAARLAERVLAALEDM